LYKEVVIKIREALRLVANPKTFNPEAGEGLPGF